MKRRVVLARSAGQELRAEKVRVLFDGKILSFTMDVGCRGHLMAAGDDAEGLVLNRLKSAIDDTLLDDGAPNTSGIGENRAHVEVECRNESPEVAPPLCSGDGLEDGEAPRRLSPQRLNMGPKGEMGVPDNS